MKNDFATDHLKGDALKAAKVMLSLLPKDASGGGCRAFYTPEEWKERGEDYGTESVLVVCHDGGDLAPYLNMDYCAYKKWEEMFKEFEGTEFYVEQCTSWYSAVYPR